MRLIRKTEHDGDRETRHAGFKFFRRLTLVGPDGEFLDRRGIDLKLFGIYLHKMVGPDPGLDLHDHPWPFVSLILRGGYVEERATIRRAAEMAVLGDLTESAPCEETRRYRVGQLNVMRMTDAHRISIIEPRTWTLVLRGRKMRPWGFYLPEGWVSQYDYDYGSRRPSKATRDDAGTATDGGLLV